MALTGDRALVAHRGPARRALILVLTTATALVLAGGWLLVRQYNERPPWAEEVAYEAGFLLGNRIRHYDLTGEQTRELLAGGCARLERTGGGGSKAAHDPGLWVDGCLDGAAGRQPTH